MFLTPAQKFEQVFFYLWKNIYFRCIITNYTVTKWLFTPLLLLQFLAWGQPPAQDSEAKKRALSAINKAESKTKSTLWPNVNSAYFFKNLKENVEHPLYINQGKPTYFCGYAALTHFLVLSDPEEYVRLLLDLFLKGQTTTKDQALTTSESIRKAAGTLYNKGVMDVNHADQIWFMALADNYKGYLNRKNMNYLPGDENKFWAATNFKKFNRMLRSLTGYEVHAKGADLIGPVMGSYYEFIEEKMQDHTVILYLNNKALYPNKFFRFILPTPTHFVVLYNLERKTDYNVLDYWDYGLRTKMNLRKKRFRRLIYGITYIKKK